MGAVAVASTTTHTAEPVDEFVLPLHSEQIDVSIRQVVTGEVEISTATKLHDAVVDEELISHHAEIERVMIGRIVDAAPNIREEDGVLIIPVMEEIVVVERRLVLKEELRIRRSTSTRRHQETVTLRQQEAVVVRKTAAAPPDAPSVRSVTNTPEENKL